MEAERPQRVGAGPRAAADVRSGAVPGPGPPELLDRQLALGAEPPVLALELRHDGEGLVAHAGGTRAAAAHARSEAQAERIAQHGDAVAQGAHAALLHVPPLDGHLLDAQAETVGEEEQLDIEGEAGDRKLLEEEERRLAREHLEAALRVVQARETEQPQRQVERPPRELAQPGLAHGNDTPRGGPRRAHHVGVPALDGREAALDVGDSDREVGIRERDRSAAGSQDPSADRSALAQVALQANDRGGERRSSECGPCDRDRVVVAAVVDEDDLRPGIVERGSGEGVDGSGDPWRLAVHRDDQRPRVRCALPLRHG